MIRRVLVWPLAILGVFGLAMAFGGDGPLSLAEAGGGVTAIGLECYGSTARRYVRAVVDALERVAEPVDRCLGERDVTVFVDRRWTDIWPDWDPGDPLEHRGDGYRSWAECGAFWRRGSRRVYMVEEFLEDGEYRPDTGNAWPTLMHELGHALDETSEPRPSQDPEYRRIYLRERRGAKAVEPLHYYTWHWSPGSLETFATAFAACDGALFDEDDPVFLDHFGGCVEWVGSYLAREGLT